MSYNKSEPSLRRWMPLLILTGLITLAVCIFPELVSIGLVYFIVPGLIFFLAPPIFTYTLGLLILSIVTSRMGVHTRIVPLLLATTIVLTIPYILNQSTYNQAQGLIVDDIDIQASILLKNSIAFIIAPPRAYNARDPVTCDAQCQKLLYNGEVKEVMIGKLSSFNIKDITTYNVKTFFIERKKECLGNIKSINPVNRRIASGECLMSATASLANADTIHVHQILRDDRRKSDLYLKATTIKAKRNRILEKTVNGYKTVYQKTEVRAKPLLYPLIFGVIPKYGFDMDVGFVRTNLVTNDFGKISIKETSKIFGNALRTPLEPEVLSGKVTDTKSLIREAFASTGTKKTAGHDLFDQYLRELFEKKITPTDEDIELVTMALKDDRAGGWFYLSRFIISLDNNVPSKLIQELGNRLVRNKSSATSNAIRFLPAGMASGIYSQLLISIQDKTLRNKVWGAISRLGDGNKKEAIASYISIIEEWTAVINLPHSSNKSKAIRSLDKVTTGALIGLCRIGQAARPAKEKLFSVVLPKHSRSTISMLAIDALLQMGAIEELKYRYGFEEELWKNIERAVAQRDRAIKKNRPFCGKRVV